MPFPLRHPVSPRLKVAAWGLPALFMLLFYLPGCEPPDPRTPGGRPDAVQTYALFCAGCHGPDGRKETGATRLTNAGSLSPEALRAVIENGRGAMPSWRGRLKPDQIDALLPYVRELSQAGRRPPSNGPSSKRSRASRGRARLRDTV